MPRLAGLQAAGPLLVVRPAVTPWVVAIAVVMAELAPAVSGLVARVLVVPAERRTVATLMLLASSPSRLKNLAVANGVATWTRSPEKGITGYLVTWGPADAPEKNRLRVTTPTARIPRLTAGMVVQVKAVNARGLMGWDWARFTVK